MLAHDLPQLDMPKMDRWVCSYASTVDMPLAIPAATMQSLQSVHFEGAALPLRAREPQILAMQATAGLQHVGFSWGRLPEALSNLEVWSKQAVEVYSEVKDFLAQFTEIADRIPTYMEWMNNQEDNSALILILRYMLKGQCLDRLGREIDKPAGSAQEDYFQVALDIGKILMQRSFDEQFKLPWLANPSDDQTKAHQFWALQVSELSKPLIGAGISAGLTMVPGLQDDGKKAASMVAGVTFSKPIELVISKAIEDRPNEWIELAKKVGGIE